MSFQEHPRGGASGIRSHPEPRQLHFCLEHRHGAPPGHGALRSSPSGRGEDEEAGGRGAGEDIAAIAHREVKKKIKKGIRGNHDTTFPDPEATTTPQFSFLTTVVIYATADFFL